MVKMGPRTVDIITAAIGFGMLEFGIWRLSSDLALIVGGTVLLAASLWRPTANE